MSLNTSAALKTAAVIGVVWGFAFFSNANGSLDAARERFGFAPALTAAAGQEYGMTLSDTAKRPIGAPDGPVVTAVEPGSIPDLAKVQVGDVLNAVNHIKVHKVSDAMKWLAAGKDHGHFNFLVWRNGVVVNPANVPKGQQVSNAPDPSNVGILFSSDADRPDNAPNGLLIKQVDKGSPAESAGLKVGDVITAVNSKPALNGDVFYFASQRSWNQTTPPPLTVTVWQSGQTNTINLR
ncbi:TPA: PDZ domain-containing protein [Burkholderia vietnamiensis]|uniref:PDZ domain-containing protein n=1 Tax=Burkholderia vietnamiensis TaxID=60552 RepID=UPI001588DAF2|nr:PDZ domain-containing protein [Burkholderia vietnamiensis]HDR8948431.1 PDZ domain-containing protein [Burkholderia vietnamiensis]HDR9210674.1 PDZ domain-containing protein [Burkholderia vietnamiensis]